MGSRRQLKLVEPAEMERSAELVVQRGSLVSFRNSLINDSANLAIVVSNNLQNELSEFLLVVPLQRQVSRLNAPFAVDLGRKEGLRALHVARCDWVSRIQRSEVERIERAAFSDSVLDALELGLKVALGFREVV